MVAAPFTNFGAMLLEAISIRLKYLRRSMDYAISAGKCPDSHLSECLELQFDGFWIGS